MMRKVGGRENQKSRNEKQETAGFVFSGAGAKVVDEQWKLI